MDFLKIDLDLLAQPAIARLKDSVSLNGDVTVTQARFDDSGVTITRLRSDGKTKQFWMTTEELSYLCGFAGLYDALVMQHTVTIAERKETAIAEAKALANSVQFDYEPLNIQFIEYDGGWTISLPAITFNRWSRLPGNLVDIVTDAQTMLKDRVAYAERHNWPATHSEWNAIVTGYRKVFPVDQCQLCQKLFDLHELKKLGTGCDMLVVCDPCGQEELKKRETEQGESALKVKVNLQAPDECDSTLNQIDQKAWDNAIADIDQIVDLF